MPETPHKITIVGLNYSPELTGIAPYTTRLASSLVDRGHRVDAVIGYPHYPSWRVPREYTGYRMQSELDGVHVHRVRQFTPKRPTFIRRMLMELTFGVRASLVIPSDTSLVICVSPSLVASAITMARLRLLRNRPRVLLWVQDMYGSAVRETGTGAVFHKLVHWLETRTVHAADEVVVIHERFQAQLVNTMAADPQKINVIRNWAHSIPADITDREQVRSSRGWAADETVVLHAGNMGMKQGLHSVVHAAIESERQSLKIRFVFLGDGNQRESIAKLAQDLRTVQFIPTLGDQEYQSTLNAADILLVNELPALREMSVPSKLTSYFSTGIPVLAATDSDSATSSELARAAGGLRVEPGNPAALLEGIKNLNENTSLAHAYSSSAKRYHLIEMTDRGAIDKFEVLIKKSLGLQD